MSYSKIRQNSHLACDIYERMAKNYVSLTKLTTFGLLQKWRIELLSRIAIKDNIKFLDAAGGQGHMSSLFLDMCKRADTKSCTATVCDISPEMMTCGRKRCEKLKLEPIRWVAGNVEKLPFEEDRFDVYVNTFGIRNVNLERVVRDAYRVLKSDGQFLLMDVANPSKSAVRRMYHWYLSYLVPSIGHWLCDERESLVEFAESLKEIPENNRVLQLVEEAGFKKVFHRELFMGTICYYEGFK